MFLVQFRYQDKTISTDITLYRPNSYFSFSFLLSFSFFFLLKWNRQEMRRQTCKHAKESWWNCVILDFIWINDNQDGKKVSLFSSSSNAVCVWYGISREIRTKIPDSHMRNVCWHWHVLFPKILPKSIAISRTWFVRFCEITAPVDFVRWTYGGTCTTNARVIDCKRLLTPVAESVWNFIFFSPLSNEMQILRQTRKETNDKNEKEQMHAQKNERRNIVQCLHVLLWSHVPMCLLF